MLSSQSSHARPSLSSSPWPTLLVRSKSLEGVSSDDDEQLHEERRRSNHLRGRQRRRRSTNKSKQSNNNNNNNGAWSWLLTPPSRLVANPLHRSSSPAKRHLISSIHPSNQTMFLLRLEEIMPQFCKLLGNTQCQEAAKLLDTSFTDVSPASSNSSSPSNFFRHHASSPIEGEWETHVAPLLLLTGALSLYNQMQIVNLNKLFQTIQADLQIVKERLCDAWLASSRCFSSKQSSTHQAAQSMARTFNGLQSYLNMQIQLVNMQTRLFCNTQEAFGSKAIRLLQDCKSILASSSEQEFGSVVEPMFVSLTIELKTWIALLETATFLDKCQFTNAVLSLRKFRQEHVDTPSLSSNTRLLQLWFQHVLDCLVSIMPIYFDRITAFASPLYGFDTFTGNGENYDGLVLDFLRKHESKGGPSMAVCIVIDAVSTNNCNFARGFVAQSSMMTMSSESSTTHLTTAERERKEWPAVYMRSTVHYNASPSPISRSPSHGGGSISTIMRRKKQLSSSFRKGSRLSSEDDFSRSLANIMRPSSQDGTTTPAHHSSQVMEYPPPTGPVSWPHSEWTLLVDLVKEDLSPSTRDDGFSSVQAVTYRQPEPPPPPPPKKAETVSTTTLVGLPPSIPAPPPKPTTDSTFHLVRLSDYLTMVVIVKCEDDGKWHLRKTRGHSDEEIRVFLNEMALKLKVSILFDSVDTVKASLGEEEQQSDCSKQDELVSAWQQWDEANTQTFLKELKRSFQLRPQSPYMENLRRSRGGGVVTTGRRKKRDVSYGESAMAFFVGPDLQLERGGALE